MKEKDPKAPFSDLSNSNTPTSNNLLLNPLYPFLKALFINIKANYFSQSSNLESATLFLEAA
jgi:hypothetical protein